MAEVIEWKVGLRGDKVLEVGVDAKETSPPKPYNQGTLIAAMKNAARNIENDGLREALRDAGGIGTPATRAAIIENVISKRMVTEDKRSGALDITERGEAILAVIPAQYKDPATTAVWEGYLSQIQTTANPALVEKFYAAQVQSAKQLVEKLSAVKATLPGEVPLAEDTACVAVDCSNGGTLSMRVGSKGAYWQCGKCSQTFNDDGGSPIKRVARAPVELLPGDGEQCAKCGKGVMKTIGARDSKRFLKCQAEKCGQSLFPVEGGWEPRQR